MSMRIVWTSYCKRQGLKKMVAPNMNAQIPGQISLTPAEQNLRNFLMDVSNYIGTRDGYEKPVLRFAGGWVRDRLLGTSSHDIDVGISSLTGGSFGALMLDYLRVPGVDEKYPPNMFKSLATIKENPEKSKHLETVTTKIFGLDVDLVNLRKETYSDESRNPTMEFGTPEEDASRRDLTINAMFYNLASQRVEDPTGQGFQDMGLKIVRTPLEPFQTFKDDPLRILRCIRFASRLGYAVDPEALKVMNSPEIVSALQLKISRERIALEIRKMMTGDNLQALI